MCGLAKRQEEGQGSEEEREGEGGQQGLSTACGIWGLAAAACGRAELGGAEGRVREVDAAEDRI